MSGRFRRIICADFEYEAAPGDLPNPLSLVAYVLEGDFQHVATSKLWRGEFGPTPPFDVGPDSLFVSYAAWAELICFKVLGWKFPTHVFDQHTAYLAASNILHPYKPDEERKKEPKNFAAACRAYGLVGWENIEKHNIAEAIADGSWKWKYGPEQVLAYNEEDVRMGALLLEKQIRGYSSDWLPPVDVKRIIHWSEYASKTCALIQARGMNIDTWLWNLTQEHKLAVIRGLIAQFDPSHGTENPIYNDDGEASERRTEQWLDSVGINWPRHDDGSLNLRGDTFRLMYNVDPRIEDWHALRDSLGFIQKARLPIGKDGRNRPSLFPFGTATGRNAHAKSPYNAHAGVRSFLTCPPGRVMQYLDWRSQEVGIAAVLSGDHALQEAYRSGDVYHDLAVMCGKTNCTDPVAWKNDCPEMRDRMKPLELGVRYGMSIGSLARGLGVHVCQAAAVLQRHQERYPRFWKWRSDVVEQALADRELKSHYTGWTVQLSKSPNPRTLMNFPMQGGGAEMLREAAVRLCNAGIVPVMLIHDGLLFEECDTERLALAKEIMLKAGEDVCGGFTINVDESAIGANEKGEIKKKVLTGGDRYRDKRKVAQKLWKRAMQALEEVGALPKGWDKVA
jgi:DNA polymerase I